MDISVRNLRKSFKGEDRETQVVDGVSFEVQQGEILCIVGPSGCGKSTILRMLSGLETRDGGEIELDSERSSKMALITQTPVLLPWRTVIQNASLGAEIRGPIDSEQKRLLLMALDKFALLDFADYMPTELSGGMRQRLSIIRALESRPKILLCDEPFSSIDYVGRFSLSTVFRQLCKLYEITCVVVTHNIEEAIFLADSLIVLTSRPCKTVNASAYRPVLSVDREDAYLCRSSPEFEPMFRAIWEDLKH